MKLLIIAISLCIYTGIFAQNKEPIILGSTTVDHLMSAPYNTWFNPRFEAYQPNTSIVEELKTLKKDIKIEIYFGIWCGDSKRELPHFMKILKESGITNQQYQLIGLGGHDSLYKQSPIGIEKGKVILRVPTFIIYKKNQEIGRINEFPVTSLERDLLQIIKGEPYLPNYFSFQLIREWMQQGVLADDNTSMVGLSEAIKDKVDHENRLIGVANLLQLQGYSKEYLNLLRVNAYLYPQSANVIYQLGKAYLHHQQQERAVMVLEKALELQPNAELVKNILESLYKAKGLNP